MNTSSIVEVTIVALADGRAPTTFST